jgi:hypothetical protein
VVSCAQARRAVLQKVVIGAVDLEHVVERLLRIEHDHRRHQLGDRSDRRHFVCRFCVKLTIRGSIEDDHVGRGKPQPCGVGHARVCPGGTGNKSHENNR